MKFLKYFSFIVLGLSLLGFFWLAWFLFSTPSSAFDTQGPGLLGAFVMFGSQVLGVAGIVLFMTWKLMSMWLERRNNDKHI